MKQKNIRKMIVAIVCVVLTVVSNVVSAFANSAPRNWSGVDSTGAIIVGEDSPILVEHELLTFDIQQFPENYYDQLQQYIEYSGKVTAEYTFYNPSDYKVTATLMFPFGCEPDYAYYVYDEENVYRNWDTEKYDITVDGEAVEKTLRHTLSSGFEQFQVEKDLALLQDGYVEDDFFAPDTTVYKYTFEASGIDTATYDAANVAFDIDSKDPDRRIYFVGQSGSDSLSDETVRLSDWVENGEAFVVYVLGEDYDSFPEWTFYEDGSVADGMEIQGTMKSTGKETLTFQEFALSYWTEKSSVSEADWYNAVVALFYELEEDQEFILDAEYYLRNLPSYLMRWYEYEITLEPRQRIVNAVTAPIYPSIDLAYDPGLYSYTYLLSPAKLWESFGELEVVVNTPYYMSNCSIDGFTKTETGYTVKLDGLPKEELTFDLCSSEDPTRTYTPYEVVYYVFIAGIIVFAVVIVGVIIGLCVWNVRKRKKR